MTEGDKKIILILEDDPGIAQLESLRLRRAGYVVQVAESTEEAKTALESGVINLMLIDYRLKGNASGLDFYSELRASGLSVPSILITGFSNEEMLTQAMRIGIRDFLPKTPDYLDYVVPTVVNVLAQVQIERQLEDERAKHTLEQAARVDAELASRRKDEFLATLAHELRNPLAAISNAVQVLLRCGGNKEEMAWSGAILDRQVKNLGRILEDLLDVSRIATGKIQLRMEPLDVCAAIGWAVEATRPLMESRNHAVLVNCGTQPLFVKVDATRFEQILINLLTNAAKYTEPDGQINVLAGKEQGTIFVTIQDSGIGISAAMLPKVFDLFEQADQSLDRSQGGLGIGLTLVKKLVELHHGSVSAESAGPGCGSSFTVRLPEEVNAAPVVAAPTFESPDAASACILIVDDNIDTATSMAKLFELSGYEAHIAHDGYTALRLAEAHGPGFVLLDIGLPGIDGYEVARRLRLMPGSTHTVLIAISGYGQEEDRQRSREAGFDCHLVKPVNYDELMGVVRTSNASRVH